jgi:hypothetical protein
MTVPGNSALLLTLLAVFVIGTGYAAGRLHQWYRTGLDRDEAYRDGYDTATRSVFSLAARIIAPKRAERAAIRASASVRSAAVDAVTASGSPPRSKGSGGSAEPPGRHTVPEELVRAATYRLPPDRVARAKVPKASPPPSPSLSRESLKASEPPEVGTSRVSVPKPRSS